MMPLDLTEHTIDSVQILDGRMLKVFRDRVRLPNGHESSREYIRHPGAAVIIPLFDNGDILLERQHRYALRRDFLELPAGKLDPNEAPLTCAQRELIEETGYAAERWDYLTTLYPCIGYSDERMAFYLARDLKEVGNALDEDEFLEILRVPMTEALTMIQDGRINEAKTVMGLLWLQQSGLI